MEFRMACYNNSRCNLDKSNMCQTWKKSRPPLSNPVCEKKINQKKKQFSSHYNGITCPFIYRVHKHIFMYTLKYIHICPPYVLFQIICIRQRCWKRISATENV